MGSLTPDTRTVLITGFGPWGSCQVNASWIAVQELAKIGIAPDINVVIKEIPVEYKFVKETVPDLWNELKPILVVHVGVSGETKEITLEQQAHNDGYVKNDACGFCVEDSCCIDSAPEILVSNLDMSLVKKQLDESQCKVESVVSYDPGRFVCDFTYFTSLNIDEKRTGFIHVPPLDKPYSAHQLALALQCCIRAMLSQISD